MARQFLKILCILVLIFFSGTAQAYFNPGQPTGFVNDYTNTLNTQQKQALEKKLSDFENSGNEISIALIDSLKEDTIENFAVKLFEDWGIGKKEKDNGVLILVAKNDREMRIEVGYGLEGALTDAQSNWIINKVMKPSFQANDFFTGLSGAADKIISATEGENIPEEKTGTVQSLGNKIEMFFSIALFAFIWLSSILARSKSWWAGGIIGGIAGVVVGLFKGFLFFGIISLAVLIPLGLLLDYSVSKQYKKGKTLGSIPWWAGGNGRGGFGGSSGGFGGFGGGRSGGGGSSGGW